MGRELVPDRLARLGDLFLTGELAVADPAQDLGLREGPFRLVPTIADAERGRFFVGGLSLILTEGP